MRVYVSGPMSGLAGYNYPAFFAAADSLRAEGHVVINPAESFGGNTRLRYAQYMHRHITDLLTAEAIFMLPGWAASRGASLEKSIAEALDLQILGST